MSTTLENGLKDAKETEFDFNILFAANIAVIWARRYPDCPVRMWGGDARYDPLFVNGGKDRIAFTFSKEPAEGEPGGVIHGVVVQYQHGYQGPDSRTEEWFIPYKALEKVKLLVSAIKRKG